MEALSKVIPFELPKKPKVKIKEPLPDQRKVCVMPIRSCVDEKLTDGAFRALALLCSYCNRAGITWVSQTKLAKDMGVSQQAISKHFKQLRELGYLTTVKRGFKGERTDTLRVVFDPTITAEEAIAMTSNKEDTRPPWMAKQEQEQANPEGLKRIKEMMQGLIKPIKEQPKEYQMPTSGQTKTVKEMKKTIANKQRKPVDNSHHIHNPKVVHENTLHSQPYHNPTVVHNTEEHIVSNSISKDKFNKLKNSYKQLEVVDVERLLQEMNENDLQESLDILLPLFQAEGLKPSSRVLADSILQLHRDAGL